MQHFTISEFDCPCGECQSNMDEGFLSLLDEARDRAGVPFGINSGYRCPEHNEAVGGSPTSSHLIGKAADISCTRSTERHRIIHALLTVGINRIGIRKDFIHCDTDKNKPSGVIWMY